MLLRYLGKMLLGKLDLGKKLRYLGKSELGKLWLGKM